MQNPFTLALNPAKEYGYPDDSFDLPSSVDLTSVAYPVPTGLGGGVAAYRGNQADQFQSDNPGYAGEYELGFMDATGIVPGYNELNPAPGSASLLAPRGTAGGGQPGTNRIIHSEGPVSGVGSEFSGLQAALNAPNPQYAGPVSGGADYSQQLAASYFAAQAIQFSEQASASAMVSAV